MTLSFGESRLMKILKHTVVTRSSKLDFFIIRTFDNRVFLEWSGPTREKSGRLEQESVESAINIAESLFDVSPDFWIDGDHHFWWADRQPKDMDLYLESKLSSLEDVWECFTWLSPQIPQLAEVLAADLQHRSSIHEQHKQDWGQADPDDRTINRDWCHELSFVLRRWCALLELDPDDLPGYRKALRENVWNGDLIPTNAISPTVVNLLTAKSGIDDLVFRPTCLDVANQELMNWLQRHPHDVDRVHHRTFEAIVSEIIKSSGWSVEMTKQTRDGGFDLLCLQNTNTGVPIKMLVETKLYNLRHSIGLPIIDRLMGVRDGENADRAVIVTNSRFSRTIWKRWEERVGRDLTLIDREELFEWLRDGRM